MCCRRKLGQLLGGFISEAEQGHFPLFNDAFQFTGALSHRFRSPNSAAATETPKAAAVPCKS